MEEDSLCGRRAKRQKIDKSGRSAAFERLKSLKGKKNKCEIGEVENVYDEVDEKEYSKRVLKRQEEDWLEGSEDGYIEDGREIFDDDEDDEKIFECSKRSKSSKKKNISKNSFKSSKSILEMVTNMPAKKKAAENDAILDDIMGELCSEFDPKPKPAVDESLSSREYLNSISKVPTVDLKAGSMQMEHKVQEHKEMEDFSSSVPAVNLAAERIEMEHLDMEDFSPSVLTENLKAESLEKEQKEMEDFGPSVSVVEHCNNAPNDIIVSSEAVPSKVNGCDFFIDKSDLPLVTNEEGERVFRFFWWDAYEDPLKQAGVVYLFGKVFHDKRKSFVSCCVCVENIERRIFLLPREKKFDSKTKTSTDFPVTLLDVYQEFNDTIANPNKIMNFKSRKVVRKYAFELADVPEESEYLEVKYPANYAKLSHDLSGETFSRVFGTNTSALESLLLEQKIKGPCWLEIKNPQVVKVHCSWCKVETRCARPEDVVVSKTITPFPPLLVMAINIRTVVNTKNMDNEIVMIASVIQNDYRLDKPPPKTPFHSHFCAFTRPTNKNWPHDLDASLPRYRKTETVVHHAERSLLNYFLTKLYTIDPDVIVGHDFHGFTLDTLMHRIQHLKIANWSRIGRLKRSLMPQLKGKQAEKSITCGRLVCDLNISARELIKARSYDLDTLCKQILNLKNARQDFSSEEIMKKYEKTTEILNLIGATMEDAIYILRLMHELNVLPLALQITNIAGNVMSRTLLGGRSERNEFLLLHAFTEKNFLVPDKNSSRKTAAADEDLEMAPKNARKKPQYAGGLVLEPKKGFYDKFILLMDFNSLYPSIIQEYNICFTTIARVEEEDAEPEAPDPGLPLGVLPTEIQKLVESRRMVKDLMKGQDLSPEQYMQYNIRQMALKLTANSMYGCLGFSFSRFYAKPLAALVTRKGREILMNTKEIVQKMKYEVIYGDTDSIMINTNSTDFDEVFKIGRSIKQEINKLYKYLELEVDGVFKYMLLLKKKKYAAVVLSKKPSGEVVASQEYKGLDIVRRDWCQLSAEVGRHVLGQILSGLSPDERVGNIREHLERIAADMRNKVVPVSLLAITKQLTKNPEDYPDKKSLPHVQVALRMNSRGGKKLRAGDTVSYVICDDGSNLPAVQRAYHVEELKANQSLMIDTNYYLSQQIHPVVSRLCEPIDGTDAAFVAECLGLDPSVYKRIIQKSQHEDEDDDTVGDYMLINDIQSFKNCEKFSFRCINEKCKTQIFMDGPMRDNRPILSKCRNPACNTSPIEYLPSILNALNLSIRYHVNRLYQNWMTCSDPACTNRTQRVPMSFSDSFPNCTLCRKSTMCREYRNADLYYQLKFYEFMFNIKRLKLHMDPMLENGYRVLHERAVQALNQSAYRILDLSKIFRFILTIKGKDGKEKKQKPSPSLSKHLIKSSHIARNDFMRWNESTSSKTASRSIYQNLALRKYSAAFNYQASILLSAEPHTILYYPAVVIPF